VERKTKTLYGIVDIGDAVRDKIRGSRYSIKECIHACTYTRIASNRSDMELQTLY